ncbi:hypothetical protein [Antarcticibacterium sp. 1MA-6-2]|uniref:hypothetical protein n=1 Tax=Antarcticibacterium sp. 1MA-6-2 TaxID=2908210 RepID=UPI002882E2E5|nr:hypothetical protein [Antarcticibacterium sp. 1MA-6-2]
MKLRRTHIPEKLLLNRNKRISEQSLLQQVKDIIARESIKDELVLKELTNYNDGGEIISNNFIIDKLEGNQIFHISDIEQICTIYRLRFLNSALYKGEFPYEAVIKIKELEKKHNINLKGFKLMALSQSF